MLTSWERTLVRRLSSFARLSDKQLAILRRLVVRALEAGAVP
jgi:hypothetical protein